MSEFPFSLRVEIFMTIMLMHIFDDSAISTAKKTRKTLLVSECACMHEKAREPKNTNAQKKASKIKIALTYFSNSAVWFHFNAIFYGSIFLFLFHSLFFGV